MATQIVLSLPDELYRRAEGLARLTSRDVGDVLTDVIALSLPPFDESSGPLRPPTELSDREVLALAEDQPDPSYERRLSLLLDKQQDGALADDERPELIAMMQVYQHRLLRKAQALAEAVRRGLRPPWSREQRADTRGDPRTSSSESR